jgi:chitodextrinase
MYDSNDYDPYLDYYFGTQLNCGAADQWHQHTIQLNAALLTGPFMIEFYIYYDWWSGGSGSGFQGWFIDDLQVLVPDVTPPEEIADLAASNPKDTSIDVAWSSPADNDVSGVCDSFDLRYATTPIDAASFDSASAVAGEPAPDVEGTSHQVTVTGLTADTTYYFAVRTTDKAGNVSLISNEATAKTLQPPPPPAPPSINATGAFEEEDEDILPCSAGTSAAPAGLMALAGLIALAFGMRKKA